VLKHWLRYISPAGPLTFVHDCNGEAILGHLGQLPPTVCRIRVAASEIKIRGGLAAEDGVGLNA